MSAFATYNESSDVKPRSAVHDVRNRCLCAVVKISEDDLCERGRFIEAADLADLTTSEFGLGDVLPSMGCSSPRPTLPGHVGEVFGLGANPEVCWVAAEFVVTGVHDDFLLWDAFAGVQRPRDTVSTYRAPSTTDGPDLSVPGRAAACSPVPAVVRTALVDLFPEPDLERLHTEMV